MERIKPGPGQESIWDYPRPPRLESSTRHIKVVFAGEVICDTERAFRVLETSHPPTWYLPPDDTKIEYFAKTGKSSVCEWKGAASYWTVTVNRQTVENACWSYEEPTPGFAKIRGYRAFYPHSFECFVDGERVDPQPGSFYGGWITKDVVGPFKGSPGTWGC